MSKLLEIITHPNDILRQKCQPIKKVDNKIKRLILDMEKTMLEKDGVGLAAPQISKNIRLVVINTKDGPVAMINPKITRRSWRKEWEEEGCLSIPDFYGKVKRSKKISLIYYDLPRGIHGKTMDAKRISQGKIRLKAEGLLARVIQHEVDHLNGVLFIDYLRKKDLPKEYKK